MKTRRKTYLRSGLLLALPLLGAAFLLLWQPAAQAQLVFTTNKPPFVLRNYGGKCLEFGVSRFPIASVFSNQPVFISDCNGTAAQQVRIEELTDRPGHLVILRAGNGVIGKKVDIVLTQETASEAEAATEQTSFTALGSTADQIPLEVQPYTGSEWQIFALDGDSIILAADRNLVVEVQRNRGANRTPLVLGRRQLDDSEFWTFTASDGSRTRPTSGFVRITRDILDINGTHVQQAFVNAVQNGHAGTVLELDASALFTLANVPQLLIPAGVTIRGDRRGTLLGPQLTDDPNPGDSMFEVAGDDVRITGLRLRGPSRSTNTDIPKVNGILAHDDLFTRTIIDHNELSDWPGAAVSVEGGDDAERCRIRDNRDNPALPARQENVRVVRNFIHHNQRQNSGYGVVLGSGGYAMIEGNTFVSNRHAIAADGRARTAYRAWNNLVLAAAPKQDRRFWFDDYTHDFDMHGTNKLKVWILGYEKEIAGFGGTGGEFVEIARNTFLGTGKGRQNFDLRGEPCFAAFLHHNISLQSLGDSIGCGTVLGTNYCGNINKLKVYDSYRFNAINPTTKLGVGDFDGDGLDDLFLATGAAWYYAPAGKAEWRFLNARSEQLDQLLFGDFDGDKRTDVFTQHDGSKWEVSWAGASPWETINGSGPLLGNAAIGDFDGDKRADVFYADGREWFVSFGGVSQFTHYALAVHRVSDLRFGDFNGDGKTDVFGVVGNNWMAVFGGTNYWAPLRAKLFNGVAGLVVADFNGDGRDDIAYSGLSLDSEYYLQVSFGATSDWTMLRAGLDLIVAYGRFNSARGADPLFWSSGNTLDISSGGTGATRRHSRQDMR
jgi:hypothetical protein